MSETNYNILLQSDVKLYFRLFIIGLIICLSGCREPFDPQINEKTNAITVDGSLIKGRKKQVVTITRSAPLYNIEYIPVTGCQVKIMDEFENIFTFNEESEGRYTAEISDNLLVTNRRYKLVFDTPDGNNYESAFEELIETAPVDSVYTASESIYSSSDQKYINVVQFYLDLKAPEEGARYYRWDLTETYEVHSFYHIDWIYLNRDTLYPSNPDSVYYCWVTSDIDELFSSNTVNLRINEKKKIPLNYVPRNSRKLAVRYSLLVKQYALSPDDYDYWHQKKVEIEESGGLYTKQPGQSKSNVVNVNDANEKILGYFWASSLSQKRIYNDIPSTFYRAANYCDTAEFDTSLVVPGIIVYVTTRLTSYGIDYTADRVCFDCTLLGGSVEKPSFLDEGN